MSARSGGQLGVISQPGLQEEQLQSPGREAFLAHDLSANTRRAIVDGLFLQWLQESDWKGSHSRYREMCERAVLTYLRATFAGSRPVETMGIPA